MRHISNRIALQSARKAVSAISRFAGRNAAQIQMRTFIAPTVSRRGTSYTCFLPQFPGGRVVVYGGQVPGDTRRPGAMQLERRQRSQLRHRARLHDTHRYFLQLYTQSISLWSVVAIALSSTESSNRIQNTSLLNDHTPCMTRPAPTPSFPGSSTLIASGS